MSQQIRKLAKLLMTIGETELKIEFNRQNLCKINAFEPYAAFQRIDRQSKGYIDSHDIERYMRDSGFTNIFDMECNHFIKFFDATKEQRLYYTDFLQVLLPCDHNTLRADASQRQTYEVQKLQSLSFDIEKQLSKLIQKELKFAKELELLKQNLACLKDYNIEYLFLEIADNGNFIDSTNLKKFLMRCSYMPNDNLLIAMIRRIDLDCDARLNYLEFVDSIRPQENYMPRLQKSKETRAEAILSPKQTNNRNKNFTRPKSSGQARRKNSSSNVNSTSFVQKSRYAQAVESKMLNKPDQQAFNPFKSGDKRNSISQSARNSARASNSFNANGSYSARKGSNRRVTSFTGTNDLKQFPQQNNSGQRTMSRNYSYQQPKSNQVKSRVRFDYEAKSPNVRYIDESITSYGVENKQKQLLRESLGVQRQQQERDQVNVSLSQQQEMTIVDQQQRQGVLYDKVNSSVNGYTIQVDRSRCSPVRARGNRKDETLAYQIRQSNDIIDNQGINLSVREQNISADNARRLRSSPKRIASREKQQYDNQTSSKRIVSSGKQQDNYTTAEFQDLKNQFQQYQRNIDDVIRESQKGLKHQLTDQSKKSIRFQDENASPLRYSQNGASSSSGFQQPPRPFNNQQFNQNQSSSQIQSASFTDNLNGGQKPDYFRNSDMLDGANNVSIQIQDWLSKGQITKDQIAQLLQSC